MTTGATPWRETGDTDYGSFLKSISRSWMPGSSPMAVEARAIYDALRPYRLTRLAAAMAWNESKNLSWTCETAPAGHPCIPAICRNPWSLRGVDTASLKGWAVYPDYATAARALAERITNPTGPYKDTRTIRELLMVYAPPSDGNDIELYISTICREIDALPLEGGKVPNPFPTPTIYDIARDADAARFGLTPDERNRLVRKCIPGRNGKRPSIIVLHIQDGVTAGSLDWWANNVDASATVMATKDGSIVRVIPEVTSGPWTNGDVQEPSPVGQALIAQYGKYPNEYTLSIESDGRPGDDHPLALVQAVAWQVTDWMERYGIPIERVIRHSDLNSVSRSFCPGKLYDRVMLAVAGGQSIGTWRNKPDWLPDSMVKTLFPEAVPSGLRSEAWLAYCEMTGRAPRRTVIHAAGTAEETLEFSDGLLIFKNGSMSWGR